MINDHVAPYFVCLCYSLFHYSKQLAPTCALDQSSCLLLVSAFMCSVLSFEAYPRYLYIFLILSLFGDCVCEGCVIVAQIGFHRGPHVRLLVENFAVVVLA